ncbi:cysteine desulfurase family protein [[Leptolyngbya] sp. PCC 7376]|uniref:cysteine desulfurase-like protein n=1 Tax=[Leptolyngbya] sp. PCC 7376 TaxID=111781 RepID=UPI00029EC956|nr:cysteine desulfurase-like protein [[Leptolyngbya] sp. PCC 7376]AFY36876.1 cysteine desulfurase family protein [[Leptolyngbya] sp. PCC 7376]
MSFDIDWIRQQFPALTQKHNGQPVIFFDGPGGTQVPNSVISAMTNYLVHSNANAHGAFITSERTDATITAAREAMADFLGCDGDEIVFGANMTSLTFRFSRAIARELKAGDEIVVTRLDHDANVAPWMALEEKEVVVRMVDINPSDCTLDMADLEKKVGDRTKLIAVVYASNASGSVNNIPAIVRLAHQVGAWVFVDAVHYAPHGSIDVRAMDCDFLVCSAYKFFGPHVGILYGKRKHLARLRPYKVRPAADVVPSRWETGTLNFEGLAGVIGTIDYLTELGRRVSSARGDRHALLVAALDATRQYERKLCEHLVMGLLQISGVTIYGITELVHFDWRVPTVSIHLQGYTPYELAKALGDRDIFTWHGNVYALNLTERLGIESKGGFLRIGLVHYNTLAEIDRLLATLQAIAPKLSLIIPALL